MTANTLSSDRKLSRKIFAVYSHDVNVKYLTTEAGIQHNKFFSFHMERIFIISSWIYFLIYSSGSSALCVLLANACVNLILHMIHFHYVSSTRTVFAITAEFIHYHRNHNQLNICWSKIKTF